ncbi:adenine deaminase C-terminal domain-containing protein [Thermodesulfobacteriota bacterium]
METRDVKKLIKVALGQEKADLAVLNTQLVNVYTGEILENHSVCIKDKWIAYVGTDPQDSIGPETHVIDAEGKTVIPGLIDGHTHIAWFYTAEEFLKYAIKGGTTTVVTETLEPYPVCGYEGVIDFLDSLKDQPIKLFATAPAMVSISQEARGIPTETLKKLFTRPEIIGLGESYWQAILQEPEQYLPQFNEALLSGKTLEGHSAGARGKKLIAYAAAGISSCHEPIAVNEVIERLRLGIYVMIREGSIRRDLEEISEIRKAGVDLRRLVLVTDSVIPEELIEKGYMEYVVQKAIDCGFDPVTAIQMATLNVADHFKLDHLVGGIAPGRFADMVVIPDVRTIEAQVVISNGRVVAQEGSLLEKPRKHRFNTKSLNSINLPEEMTGPDFSISVNGESTQMTVRVIDMVTDLVTREISMDLAVEEGKIKADLKQDLLKIAAIDRANQPGKTFVGLIRGFQMKTGAIACSAAWDTSDIVVVGAMDNDMAQAVNRIRTLQGGAVVCAHGNVLAELPLPIFGIMSDLPLEDIVKHAKDLKKASAGLGIPFSDPILTLITLTSAAIPYLRICEEGLMNLKDGKIVGLY